MNKKITFFIIFYFLILNKIICADIASSLFMRFLKEPIKEGAKNIYNKVGFSNVCFITGGLFLGLHFIDKEIEINGGKENILNILKKIALNIQINNSNRNFLAKCKLRKCDSNLLYNLYKAQLELK